MWAVSGELHTFTLQTKVKCPQLPTTACLHPNSAQTLKDNKPAAWGCVAALWGWAAAGRDQAQEHHTTHTHLHGGSAPWSPVVATCAPHLCTLRGAAPGQERKRQKGLRHPSPAAGQPQHRVGCSLVRPHSAAPPSLHPDFLVEKRNVPPPWLTPHRHTGANTGKLPRLPAATAGAAAAAMQAGPPRKHTPCVWWRLWGLLCQHSPLATPPNSAQKKQGKV